MLNRFKNPKLMTFLLLILALSAKSVYAVDGYDTWNHTRISIIAGDRIAVGEDLGIYIWSEQRYAAVEVENIIRRGNELELEVTERKTNKYFYFEIATDDPEIATLPQFDPGLPFPQAISPQLHQQHNLLELRGNMIEQGNQLEQDNPFEGPSMLENPPELTDERLLDGHHLLYQGLQPVE